MANGDLYHQTMEKLPDLRDQIGIPRRKSDRELLESLEERLAFEQLITNLLNRVVNESINKDNDYDALIDETLAQLSMFMEVDFSTFIISDPNSTFLKHTHQWIAPGIETGIDFTGQDLDFSSEVPWLARMLHLGHPIAISQVSDFPAEAVKEQMMFKGLGLKSVLWVPFMTGNKLAGCIVLNMLKQERQWHFELINRLELVGQIFADVLQRNAAQQQLCAQLELEQLFANLSSTFVHVPSSDIDERINDALCHVGEYVDCDESFLIQLSQDSKGTGVTHGWFRNGKVREQNFDPVSFFDTFPWAANQFKQNKAIVYDSLSELPNTAIKERNYLEAAGIKSGVAIPVVGNTLLGVFFVQNYQEREWAEVLLKRLNSVADIFANVLQRKKADQELCVALTEVEKLKERLEAENVLLRKEIDHQHRGGIIGKSDVIRTALAQAEQVASLDTTVLVLGETGTGKELLAHAIHDQSPRKDRPMVIVNCAALPSTLIEAELFGREKGAYTGALSKQIGRFELADGSSIFLDEVGEMPLELQAKLLRVLQHGEFERLGGSATIHVDVRVIAATNRDLKQEVRAGKFREDLYYRLNVFPITMPPLRQHPQDIPELVWAIVQELAESMGKAIDSIPKPTMQALIKYPWPGNVRELRNVIERGIILTTNRSMDVDIPKTDNDVHSTACKTLEEVEKQHILTVLQRVGWRVRGAGCAAEILDINPCTLDSRMKKLGIKRPS